MAKKQNDIFKRQNEEEMQELIVAQHFTYSNAKVWSAILFFVLVVAPIIVNIVLYFKLPDIVTGVLAFISLILLGIGELVRDYILSQKKLAAMLQQKFDVYVFNMAGQCGIDENLIAIQVEKYKNKDWNRKLNWYQNYENMPKNRAIFYCQKENIDWTGNVSKKYCHFLLATIALLLISFLVNLIINNSSIIKILSILLTAFPLISYAFSSYKKIKHDNEEFLELVKFTKEIDDHLDEIDDIELSNKVNILQTMIYKFRQSKYLIPDWFENRFQKCLQSVENRKAEQRISKYKSSKKRKDKQS